MNVRCILGHKWRLYSARTYMDISYGDRVPSTTWDIVCDNCAKTKKKIEYGGLIPTKILVARYHGWSKFVE